MNTGGSPRVVVVMGVAGSGKTTVGSRLAQRLGWPFQEGDDLHPRSNLDKMRSGHPLTDGDRKPWLAEVRRWIEARLEAGEHGVITCSALKRAYREAIEVSASAVVFVFLRVSKEVVAARWSGRQGHFMPAALIDSQFADLEVPGPGEPAISVDGEVPAGSVVDQVADCLGLSRCPRV